MKLAEPIRFEKGAPCKRGETAARTGCIPAKRASTTRKSTGDAQVGAQAGAVKVNHFEGDRKALARVFRKQGVKLEDLPGLVGAGGAPPGSEVNVTELSDGAWVTLRGEWGMAERTITNDGKIKNSTIVIYGPYRGKGIGTAIVADQVDNAVKHGFQKIVAFASGYGDDSELARPIDLGAADNGYYTWPRLGFESELPDHIVAMLPRNLRWAETVSDLMESKAGRNWWKRNGEPLTVTFDLSKDSLSRRVLAAYLKEKGMPKRQFQAEVQMGQTLDLNAEEEAALDRAWDFVATKRLATPLEQPLQFAAKVKWTPYTHPKTGRKGKISEGGRVVYDEPAPTKGYEVETIPDTVAAAALAGPHNEPVRHPAPILKLTTQPLTPPAGRLLDEAWEQLANPEQDDYEDTQTPLLFSFDEPMADAIQQPIQFDADDWTQEKGERGADRWRNKKTDEVTYEDPTRGRPSRDDLRDSQRSDVGRQSPVKEEDSWVSVSLATQRAKWQQKLESAQGDYARYRQGLRDKGLSHQEIEADRGLVKAKKKIAAIQGKIQSLEGGEKEVRQAQQAMSEPMQAFTRGEIGERELNEAVKPSLAKIAKDFGAKKVKEWYRSGKIAVQRKAIELRFNWPEYVMAAVSDIEGWVRSTIMSEHGLPSTAAWVASFAIVKGLDWLKKGVAAMKKKRAQEPKQHARRRVPDEVVDLVHEWMLDLAKAMEIDGERVPSKEQIHEQMSGRNLRRGEPRQFAKQSAEDAKVLAALLNGSAVGDMLFIPLEPGRQARVRVVNVTEGDGPVQVPDGEPMPLLIVDSRDETGKGTFSGQNLYFCYGAGEVDLDEAEPIEPGDTDAICKHLRKGPPPTPSELDRFRPPKKFSAEENQDGDDYLDLAEEYAATWNELLASGEIVPDEQIRKADEDLAAGGWEVVYDDGGEQFVVAELAPFVNKKTGSAGRITQAGRVRDGEAKRKR